MGSVGVGTLGSGAGVTVDFWSWLVVCTLGDGAGSDVFWVVVAEERFWTSW